MSKTSSAVVCETNQVLGKNQENVYFHSLYRLPEEFSSSYVRSAKSTAPIQICALFSAQGDDTLAAMTLQAADKVWCMVTADGTTIELSRVSFLLASDQSETFSIVCNDGQVIYQVASISFAQAEPTGISNTTSDRQTEFQLNVASSSLQLRGCQAGTEIVIYDAGGKTVRREMLSSDGVILIDGMPTGVYILKAGSAAVKFVKR